MSPFWFGEFLKPKFELENLIHSSSANFDPEKRRPSFWVHLKLNLTDWATESSAF